jgi:probable O-glycosylation ligase (exosortase A-associated)
MRRPALTLAGAGFVIYLWVIHSFKAPLGAAAIVLGLVGVGLQREKLRVPAPALWLGAFLLWAGVGYFTAQLPDITAQKIWEYLKIWLIFLLALNLAHTRSQLRWMMIAWLGIFALYPVRGILFNFVAGIQIQGRYAWNVIFANPNDFATLTLPVLAMSVAMLQAEKQRWVKYCALAGVIVLPLAIVITQSRGGILALLTFSALVLVQYRRRVGTIVLVLIVLAGVVQFAPPELSDRLTGLKEVTSEETIGEADPYGSAKQRYDIWRVARAIIKDHPVFGIGIGSYPEVHLRYARTGKFPGYVVQKRDTHSTYLHAAAETGLPGLGLFLGVVLATFIKGFRAASRLKTTDPVTARSVRTLLFGLIAFLQACLFASMEHLPHMYIYIAIIMTMIAVSQPNSPAKSAAPSGRRRG